MPLNRNKLYIILFIACLAGYVWLYFSITHAFADNKSVDACMIKHATNIPCPSCGTTRSIISLTKGDWLGAFKFNPFGYIVASIMFVAPIWIFKDMMTHSNSLFLFYQKIETYLKKPRYVIPLILFVIINWIWNIIKGL